MIRFIHYVVVVLYLATMGLPSMAAEPWLAGTARVCITPSEPMRMSGYGGRVKVAEGKLTDLWAKALVLRDATGSDFVMVSFDLIGMDRPTSLAIRQGICDRHGLQFADVALFCSHTHTGPVVGTNLSSMYELNEMQIKQVDQYAEQLIEQVGEVVDQAFADLEPVALTEAVGEATFAVNRRNNPEADVPRLREEGQLQGPVDHRVPVLRVQSKEKLKAIVFGYACHGTVLSSYQWSGDYPGFAQIEIEASHPETVALFVAGCGADQNPLPRRTVDLARNYGTQLAEAVEAVLDQPMTPIAGKLSATYKEIPLTFAKLPTREALELAARSDDRFEAGCARTLLKQWEELGHLAPDYPYPVQTWKFGNGPVWVILGGEVVVDYALRIRHEHGDRFWTAAYANDVMAYIPSRRVLLEGGYEVTGSMRFYGHPSAWKAEVEKNIIQEINSQLEP